MKMSETISEVATALSIAQGMIDDATKTGLNPAFRSKYADLAAVRAVIREPLAKNGLAIVQGPRRAEGGVEVETMLIHKSGEWISESVFIPITKWDAHGMGSGITYGRRYGLMSILCIATEDDDGNSAVEKGGPVAPAKKAAPKVNVEKVMEAGKAAATNGTEALRSWYKNLSNEERGCISADDLTELKVIAGTSLQKDDAK
jgi:hypothetical protein